jgi:hypothetical protein
MKKMIKYAAAFSFSLICVLLTPFAARVRAATGLIGQGKSAEALAGTLFEFQLTRSVAL